MLTLLSVLSPITKKKFTQMLGDIGIKPTKRSNANIFYVTDLEDAFKRYSNPYLDKRSTSSTCSIGGGGRFLLFIIVASMSPFELMTPFIKVNIFAGDIPICRRIRFN